MSYTRLRGLRLWSQKIRGAHIMSTTNSPTNLLHTTTVASDTRYTLMSCEPGARRHSVASGNVLPAGHAAGGSTRSERTTTTYLWKSAIGRGHRRRGPRWAPASDDDDDDESSLPATATASLFLRHFDLTTDIAMIQRASTALVYGSIHCPRGLLYRRIRH